MSANPSRVREIFLAALKLDSDQWSAYLDEACRGDEALHGRVHDLLAAHRDAGSFLVPAAPALTATTQASGSDAGSDAPGTVIGPYKLLERIGEGGFGVVFMAEQQRPVRRKVALKILKAGMDTRQVVARFEAERQALALMDHPNIAHVFDGGETASGRPYFVMELVRGISITDFCDQNNLSVRERLELFTNVCQAVHHAHQKGIIHRDLKPSNVLVTLHDGTPVAKVIDFGIAKATGQQLTEKTLFTNFAQMIGTPLYMSPEQAEMSGLDVDTRTDIYSLGVLAYELLTGTTPLDRERLQTAAFDEIRRMIREEEPLRPSKRISTLGQTAATVSAQRRSEPRRLKQLFRGELDWIVMKALDKDRNRRYETASALAGDVRHYLNHEPVAAVPPSTWYQLRKFARRNRAGLAITAGLFVMVTLLAAGIGWMIRDREAQRTEFERQRQVRDQEIEEKVLRALDQAAFYRGERRWPEALAAARQAEGLLEGIAGRDEVRQNARRLRLDLAMVVQLEEIHSRPKRDDYAFGGAGDFAFFKAFQEYGLDVDALDVNDAAECILGRSIRVELASGLDHWAEVRKRAGKGDWKKLLEIAALSDADEWRSRFRAAIRHSNRAILEQLASSVPIKEVSPGSLHLLGSALRGTGAIERAVELLKRAQKEYPGDLWINEDLGYLCTFEIWPRRYADGVRFTTAALALRPRNDHLLCTLSSAFSGLGQSDEAIAVCRRIIERSPDLPDGHASLGVILAGKGWLDEAEVEMRQVVRLNPRNAGNHFNLGKTLRNTRKRREAAAELREAIKIWPDFPGAYCELGLVLLEQGQFKEALAALRRGHDLGTKSPNWPYSSSGWVRMAERMVELDSKLEGYLSGRTTPANAYEREELGQLCYFKGLGQAAVRFYKEAFGAAPQPAEIKTSEHRYIAARAAALAGSGQGNDAGNLDLGERARFRREALDWLRADLAACEKYAEGKTDEVRANVQGRMRHWKLDPEFARMRGPDTLTELPEEERRSWQQFWEHVEALLRRTADEKK